MKVKRLLEVRKNTHQTHMESLIVFGKDGIQELNNYIDKFLNMFNGDTSLNLTSKIDGCLAPETVIKTTEGDVTFSKIISDYNNYNKIYTGFGKDDNNGSVVEVKLLNPHVINGEKNWCTIEFDNLSYITCTVDHPFKDSDHYTEACKLTNESKIDVI